MQKQPAEVNYFFKDAYLEFGATIRHAFANCREYISDSAELIGDAWDDLKDNFEDMFYLGEFFEVLFPTIWHIAVLVFALTKLINVVILLPIICIISSLFQAILLFICLFFVYLAYLTFAITDRVYCAIKKISSTCPNPHCQSRYLLPTYVCECGAQHTKLVPSRYGILSRTCTCGRKLKTTFFNGRGKLPGQWICPKCGYELKGGPQQSSVAIPVIGGPSSGKTCYITMAISEIKEKAGKYNLEFRYNANPSLGDDYEENHMKMSENNELPMKTSEMKLRYYQFYLTPKNRKVKNLVSLCDIAGESYELKRELEGQEGFRNANSFLFVFDPLSIAAYREKLQEGNVDISNYGASEKSMEEVLSTLVNTLQENSKTRIKPTVAVVFTKCDLPGILDEIGEPAVKKYIQDRNDEWTKYNAECAALEKGAPAPAKPAPVPDGFEAQNRVCEEFLIKYGEVNFVNMLKSKFNHIHYFATSSLGHEVNGDKFEPKDIEFPILWLVDQSISLKIKKTVFVQ